MTSKKPNFYFIEGYMTSKLTRLPLPLLEEMDKRHRKYTDNIRYMTQHFEQRDGKKILVTQHLE
ncbi:hypothetical protein HB837_14640 [Listeria innocua]|uniref:hypothetical protein n=1 Tax=Listeria innocua TaxID=1642 RepID=UPI0012F2B930|nr:hypothetical protein [Listeria innocua]ECB9830357.1 hypothetical protein [Listeria monocytogenes]MBC1353674.1 hypothetical protein [Listeria innocua]